MSVQIVRPPTNRFLSVSFGFLTISVMGSALFFWRPWAGSEMEPASLDGLVLTGFLIMVMIGLAGLAVGLIRYVDGDRRARPRT